MPENFAEFTWRHDDAFDRFANRYDILCDVFSVGIHHLWKRRVAKRIASENWTTLLDGATGTGGIILRLLAHHRTEGRTVIASDINLKMLSVAQRRLAAHGDKVRFSQLDAEAMVAVADSVVDAGLAGRDSNLH
jgi:demethylmenaquinone methyltransferase/2-methoxy-6-polyprenyl-1,4-benzoquinol methylase